MAAQCLPQMPRRARRRASRRQHIETQTYQSRFRTRRDAEMIVHLALDVVVPGSERRCGADRRTRHRALPPTSNSRSRLWRFVRYACCSAPTGCEACSTMRASRDCGSIQGALDAVMVWGRASIRCVRSAIWLCGGIVPAQVRRSPPMPCGRDCFTPSSTTYPTR
jgi:hypothetical protein